MSQNLQNFVKFQKFRLENLVDFEKCCKTHILLQKSVPIRPKTSNILKHFAENWQLPYGSALAAAAACFSSGFSGGSPAVWIRAHRRKTGRELRIGVLTISDLVLKSGGSERRRRGFRSAAPPGHLRKPPGSPGRLGRPSATGIQRPRLFATDCAFSRGRNVFSDSYIFMDGIFDDANLQIKTTREKSALRLRHE